MALILVADDVAFLRMRCAKILRSNGHEVVEAENGRDALEKYRAARPEAVLLDVTMPDMDGMETLRAIRSIDPEARVAMVTAVCQEALVMDALKSGARDFVVKPYDTARVLGAVQRLLN